MTLRPAIIISTALTLNLGVLGSPLNAQDGIKAAVHVLADEDALPSLDEAAAAEKKAVPAENAETEKIRAEIAELGLQRDLLLARSIVAKEKLAADLRERREKLDREKLAMEERTQQLKLESFDRKEKLEKELVELRAKTERWKIEKEAAAAEVDVALNGLRLKETQLKGKLSHLTLEISAKQKEVESRFYADSDPTYLDNPFKDGTLVISDRRVSLNGPISARTASDISTRIQFYNNQDSKKPIFIVIDDSPGGSVMAGYHILKAMEGSDAPVYVVVKQFAASMAACITTLADRSFAYPNAVLLHHQISSGLRGNLTQQRESLEETEQWWQRLAAPVAAKMGISTEEFIEQMYDKVSSGDWSEFADDAKKLKWVDHVVNEIRETGQEKHPDARTVLMPKAPSLSPTRSFEVTDPGTGRSGRQLHNGLVEYVDQEGSPYVLLDRPNPIDKFYMHNPDSYYRFR